MDDIRRSAIDDFIGDLDPELAGAVRASSAIRTVAVALDQVVNRSNDDIRRWGKIDAGTLASFDGDFAHARKQLEVLEAAAKTGRAMIAALEAQLTPPKPVKATK